MSKIPKQLQNKKFRFVLIDGHTKRPFEMNWTTTNNYKFDDEKLLKHIEAGNNYGVMGGYGGLIIIDCDNKEFEKEIKQILPSTYTIESGGKDKGKHFYLFSNNTEKVVLEKDGEHLGEIQGERAQCVGSGSIHPKTKKKYKVVNDVPIAKISDEDLNNIKNHYATKKESRVKSPNWNEHESTSIGSQIDLRKLIDFSKLKKYTRGEFYGSHPVHGSDGGMNFFVNPEKGLWHCFRHDSGGDALDYLSMINKICKCEDFKEDGKGLIGDDFKKTLKSAKKDYNVKEDVKADSINEGKKLLEQNIEELFTDEKGTAFASIKINNHIENWAINNRIFKNFITEKIFKSKGKPPSENLVKTLQNVYSAQAMFEGKKYEVYLRVAFKDDIVYIDVGDDEWNIIKITSEKIEVIKEQEIKFKRFNHMKPLIFDLNAKIEDIDLIFNHLSIHKEQDKILFRPYLVILFLEGIPTAILNVYGPQGAGKSVGLRMVRDLVDPSISGVMSLSRHLAELVQQVSHHYLPFFDNVTKINKEYSDFFCRAVTGEAFSKRELYTDDEDIIYNLKRKCAFNGINLPGEEPDFLDRCFTIRLKRINKKDRKTEEDLWKEFEKDKPKITGALLLAVQQTLKKVKEIKLTTLPRMADYAKWGEAATQVLGEKPNVFLNQYFSKIEKLNKEALEANPVGLCITELMTKFDIWGGTPTELLEALTPFAINLKVDKLPTWPKGAQILTRRLNEVSSVLEDEGFKFETLHDGHKRLIKITKKSEIEDRLKINSAEYSSEKIEKGTVYEDKKNEDKTVLTVPKKSCYDGVNSDEEKIQQNNKNIVQEELK